MNKFAITLSTGTISFKTYQDMLRFVANCEKVGLNIDGDFKSITIDGRELEGISGVADYALEVADDMDAADDILQRAYDMIADCD